MVAKNLIVRLATLDDAGVIASMSRELIEQGHGWSWTPERVARNIRNRDVNSIVACDGDKVIGFAIMYFGDERGHLNLLAVEAAYQRTGVGRRMLEWLRESCVVAGLAAIDLELRVSNRTGRAFYRAYGFRDSGFMPRYYSGSEAAIGMSMSLTQKT